MSKYKFYQKINPNLAIAVDESGCAILIFIDRYENVLQISTITHIEELVDKLRETKKIVQEGEKK